MMRERPIQSRLNMHYMCLISPSVSYYHNIGSNKTMSTLRLKEAPGALHATTSACRNVISGSALEPCAGTRSPTLAIFNLQLAQFIIEFMPPLMTMPPMLNLMSTSVIKIAEGINVNKQNKTKIRVGPVVK